MLSFYPNKKADHVTVGLRLLDNSDAKHLHNGILF
jgi:hypothetical protein